MNRMTLFIGAIIIAVLAILASIYYIMPGYYHILVTHDYTSGHPTHAVAFGALAIVCILAAVITRPKSAPRA